MEIRELRKEELNDAINLIWETFLKYEAPDYTEEGIREFKKTIDDEKWIGNKDFFGAFEGEKILGVIATKDFEHISLFFVAGEYHRQGIGRKLFNKVCELNKTGVYTVNSSPYGKVIYEHLGFECVDNEQCVCGMRFYPMRNSNIL